MTRIRTAVLLSSLVLSATAATAHDGEAHAPPKKPRPAPASPPAAPPAAGHHAPGDHAHASPHGGVVTTVDKDVHLEVLFADAGVQAWFYDADMKPVALPTDAKATVVVGKDVKKLDLPVMKNADGSPGDHLHAALATTKDQKVSLVIQATVAGKARSARVERAAIASTPAATPVPSAPAPK